MTTLVDAEVRRPSRHATGTAVLLAHNFYQQPGGEDSVFRAEASMLSERGHVVHEYCVHNTAIDQLSKPALLAATVWNRSKEAEIARALEISQARVAHFHNTFPLISPAAYYAARRRGVGVVQTLHNYRLLCPGSTFFRDGRQPSRC